MTWQLNESALKPRSAWMSKLTELIVSKEAFSYLEHKLKPKGPFWDLTSVTLDLHVCPQPPNLLWSGKVLGWSTLALGRKFKCSCGVFFQSWLKVCYCFAICFWDFETWFLLFKKWKTSCQKFITYLWNGRLSKNRNHFYQSDLCF